MLDPIFVKSIGQSFQKGKSIRRNLPMNGKLVIEQKLPYLCVYRFNNSENYHLSSLIKTQGAYLIIDSALDVSSLIKELIDHAIQDFKSYMIVEIWNKDENPEERNFEIRYPGEKISATIKALHTGLTEFNSLLPGIGVTLVDTNSRHPEGLESLIPLDELKKTGTLILGIGIPALFNDRETQQEYPMFFRRVRRKFASVIKIAAYEFVRVQSDNKFEHYLMLGKTRLDNLVRSADARISAISEKMDFILRVTPVNTVEEWEKFKQNKFSSIPNFSYRLISLDPEKEKRKLFNIPLENIEHPTLAFLLRNKRMEVEKQLTMLEERGTKKFLYNSMNLFGELDDNLKKTALVLLNNELPNEQKEFDLVNAVEFARAADAEMEIYRAHFPDLSIQVKIKDNVNGLMVSGSELSVSKHLSISRPRMNALIQHEVGTHILTYCNGRKQPLGLMYAGFAGYEQTQEGIAVLSEYLVGGLDVNRLKLLAARVLAVDTVIKGGDFIETFNLLTRDFGFKNNTAFNISMRVHRGGGYTKDAIYLKGLMDLLEFIRTGGNIFMLYGGKFALNHLPLIEELTHLRIIKKPVLPAYLLGKDAESKLNRLKNGLELQNLVN